MLVSFFARHPCMYVTFTSLFYLSATLFSTPTALTIAGLATILRWRLTPMVMTAASDRIFYGVVHRAARHLNQVDQLAHRDTL